MPSNGTRHVIHSFCLIQCHLFIHAAPDMPSIHSVSYPVTSLYTRGTRHTIHSFCLIQCHPFVHAAPDIPSIHSVLASAIPLYTWHQICHPFILSYPVPFLYTRGLRHAIYSVLASAIPGHQTCCPFIHSYSPRNAIYVSDMSFHMRKAPGMSSVHTGTGMSPFTN